MGICFVSFLWVTALNNGKKRKIGLTTTSYLALFLTPLIGCIVPLFTKKIDKSQKWPTYKQRLPYEDTAALLISEILYFSFSVLSLFAGIMGHHSFTAFFIFIILLSCGCTLSTERKNLLLAEKESSGSESEDGQQKRTEISSVNDKLNFVFESNVQQRIEADTNSYKTAQSIRRIEVKPDGKDNYQVSITDGENSQQIMQKVLMHAVSYSDVDECWSLKSNDVSGEYSLNVFYKYGNIYKCIVYRKSKDIYIHYLNE